ncbi:MAG: hypothetical protein HOD63_13860 [Bacteroidetes bacterium]|jgi:hypothetical protein|nr:hypothetical protein [Bacteroidota bacterium]MBT5528136.1 hypothetical protein [Cytophagia bacterium]MBT3801047.1 hypothetical protein [Bacteroidota bacterium]MBT3935500.1 hypothetical protein [Bacteroidota bacterium]MBT4339674.1 hypothetical protein [Bacteroidota bacterium]
MSKEEHITQLSLFLLRVEELLATSVEDCRGHNVDWKLFNDFKKEMIDFLNTEIGKSHELTKEFLEVVTENKKYKVIYARVILKDLLQELKTGEKSQRA